MNESSLKKRVLETLWTAGSPMELHEIVEKTGLGFSSLMAHLQRLVKAGVVSTPRRGLYTITNYGKEAIGITEYDEKRASAILSAVPSEKAFRFYSGIDNYSGVCASSLNEFCKKIQVVDLDSIKFHLFRQDFEFWVRDGLGDPELAHRISLIRTMDLSGERLRKRLHKTVESRCRELEDQSLESL